MKFVDDFVSYCEEFTGCPKIFLEWSAMLCLSAVAGDKHIHRRGDWDVRPNLWLLLLGNSSSYKSTGLAAARRLLSEVAPAMIASQDYSYEKFVEEVAVNPHCIFFYDEAESFFSMLSHKYNASMKPLLMSLWSRQPFKRKIKGPEGNGETMVISNAYLCWGGASTPVQIAEQIRGASDLLSGMIPRFLIVPYFGAERSIEDPPPANPRKKAKLIEALRSLISVGEREYVYNAEALKAKHRWLSQFDQRMRGADSLLGAFYKKMRDDYFHRVAMLSAFERGATAMNKEDVGEAIDLLWSVESGWKEAVQRLTSRSWDRDADRVEEFIQAKREVDRADILQGLRGIRAQKLTKILEGLAQDEKVKIEQIRTGGRNRCLIKWAKIEVSQNHKNGRFPS